MKERMGQKYTMKTIDMPDVEHLGAKILHNSNEDDGASQVDKLHCQIVRANEHI